MNVSKENSKLFEKQKSLEIKLERDTFTEVENQSKLLELKNDYNLDKDKSFSDVEHPFICPSQTANKLKN